MRKFFFTGLALLLPLVMTMIIVIFIINVLTNPLMGLVSSLYNYYDLFNEPFLFFSGPQVLAFASKFTILVFLVVLTVIIGFFGRMFFVASLGGLGEYIIHRLPIVNKIYKMCQDIVHTIFGHEEKRSFTAVVLVPFPHEKNFSIGLVTNEAHANGSQEEYHDLISVFIPGTPNPAMGFMLFFRRNQLIFLDMTVQQAFKFVVSCGVVLADKNEQKSE